MSICTGIIFVVVELAVTEILSISIDLAIPIKKSSDLSIGMFCLAPMNQSITS